MPKDDRALVQGVRIVKRHTKPTGWVIPAASSRKRPPIHLSNVMLIDPKTDKPTKVGFRVLDGGRKVRFAKSTGEVIEN